jgi:hypothetical protein
LIHDAEDPSGLAATAVVPTCTAPPILPEHCWFEHVAPELGEVSVGHAVPHEPQLFLSVLMSTHAPEHWLNPFWQPQAVPLVHVALVPHDIEPTE